MADVENISGAPPAPPSTPHPIADALPISLTNDPGRIQPLPHRHPVGLLPAIQSMLAALIAALFVMTFTVQPIRIPSSSMEPTLLVGDFMLMDKQIVEGNAAGLLPPVNIKRGDIVVFHDPVDDPRVHLVKRVIGIPGDTIHLREGVVYLNEKPLKESYAVYRQSPEDRFRDDFPDLQTMETRVNPFWWIRLRNLVHDGEVTIPPASYFVMGDNRNDSEDSRYWGFVPRNAIVGKPLLIYFSWCQPGGYDSRSPFHPETDTASAATSFARWDRTFRVVR